MAARSRVRVRVRVLFFFRLGERPLWDIDEGMHAATSKVMVETGDWLTPYLQITVNLTHGKGPVRREFTLGAVPDGWPRMDELVRAWRGIGEEIA